MASQTSVAVIAALALSIVGWLASFIRKWRKQRARYQDLPCPPHHWFWGHLKVVGEAQREMPQGCESFRLKDQRLDAQDCPRGDKTLTIFSVHYHALMCYIGQKYNLPNIFYLDLWPMSNPMMMIQDPEAAAQMTQTKSLPKHPVSKLFLGPLCGDRSVVTAEGSEWKFLRSILNPGFSTQYLSTLIPVLVRHGQVFKKKIEKHATSGAVFPFQDVVMPLTFDIISEMVLGRNTDSQRQYNDLAYNFTKAVEWITPSLDIVSWNIAKPFKHYYARQVDLIIESIIRERYAENLSKPESQSTKAAIDLFLQAYQEEKMGSGKKTTNDIDPEFMLICRNNVKTLLLGGHDTTAATMSYTQALLSEPQNKASLERVRAEHDAVFGKDPTKAMETLLSDPKLLGNLPITTAAIKESMRLFPPASTTRVSFDESPLRYVQQDGKSLPLADHQVWVSHYGIGQNTAIWPRTRAFILDRFLPNPSDPSLIPPKDAWRPFEKGPRGCLGLELAMMEMRLVLVLMCREYEFELAYDEDAPKGPEGHGVMGGRGYQVVEFAAHPKGHMPMRVRRRE
jgi:sterigmatocystin biosynthesis cytochrome P450 monooxygenase